MLDDMYGAGLMDLWDEIAKLRADIRFAEKHLSGDDDKNRLILMKLELIRLERGLERASGGGES